MSDITLNDFKKNLDAGKYKSIAGGRRGVGKIQGWDDATREQARKLVDKHFGATGVVPAPKAQKAAPKAKTAAKADAGTATGKRRGRPPGSGKKQQAAQAPKAAAKPKAVPKAVAAAPVKRRRNPAAPSGEKSIGDMTVVVGTISEALRAIKMCRDMTTKPGDLDPEALAAGRILGSVVHALGQAVVPSFMSEASSSEASAAPAVRRRGPRKAEEAVPVNGLANPNDESPGEAPPAVDQQAAS